MTQVKVPKPKWYDEKKVREALEAYFEKEDMGLSYNERYGCFDFGDGCSLNFGWDETKGKLAFSSEFTFCDFAGDRVDPPSYDTKECMTVYKASEIEMAMSDATGKSDPEYGQPEYDPTD
jgi:hypothetical protein